ncbi:MAG: glycoside hydrolase family 9 protein, partial [Pseudomonadota bacterium]
TGLTSQTRAQQQAEDPRGQDYTLTDVHRLDFSDVSQPGEYRLCVEGIGCSFDFEIAADTWANAFFTSVRGFYHQRSGIALGEPHTSFSRPRPFHPDDGLRVYQSGATLQEVDMGIGCLDTFEALNSKKTDTIVPNAWGGYFDAGDWDRRIQHLAVPRRLLELHNLFPEYFRAVNLNIPESANALPDILDEALWSLDFFRRLQTPEGGIRGGIQSAAEGGVYGEASWQESLDVMAYAPDEWSSYSYAGVAARAAFTLQAYDEALANTYRESALQAMAYAESNYKPGSYDEGQLHHVKDQRNLSALELYRLTGDTQWHDLFLATTIFQDPAAEASVFDLHEQRDAAFLYARFNQGPVNQGPGNQGPGNQAPGNQTPLNAAVQTTVNTDVQTNARASFLRYADSLVALTNTTAFGWSKDHPKAPLGW